MNAWDNEDFVKAVRATGRRTLIMAGVWTSVCVTFPALDAKAAGFKVYAVTDASGDPSEMASRTTLARLAQAGIVPTTANAELSEIYRTWNLPEAAELTTLYALATPHYAAATRRPRTSSGRQGEDDHIVTGSVVRRRVGRNSAAIPPFVGCSARCPRRKLGVLPSPAEVGLIRLRPLQMANSGKPEFLWGGVGGGCGG